MRIEAVLAAHHGAMRREDLLICGVSRREIQQAQQRGCVTRPYRGCYALPGASRGAVAAAALRGFPTCVTAFRDWGVPVLDPAPRGAHVAVPRNRGVTRADPRIDADVVVHRGAALTGVAEVDAADVVYHASRCMPRESLLVAVDHLLHRRLLDASRIRCVSPSTTRWLAEEANAGAESPPETLARLALRTRGLSVRTQVSFDGIGRVDLMVGDAVVVEVDGRHYHSDPIAFVADRRRDRALQELGFRVLRFAASEVLSDPACVARAVVAQLGGAWSAR
ncbi:DUF559 domain-containing protein [Demequina sp. TTPB684]